MVKGMKERSESEKKMTAAGFADSCKFLVGSLLLICLVATAVQFLPHTSSFPSPSDLRSYLTALSAAAPLNTSDSSPAAATMPKSLEQINQVEERASDLVVKRAFTSMGSIANDIVEFH